MLYEVITVDDGKVQAHPQLSEGEGRLNDRLGVGGAVDNHGTDLESKHVLQPGDDLGLACVDLGGGCLCR